MGLIEIYVLCENRTQKLAKKFLNKFAEERENTAEDFPFPEYASKPKIIYNNENQILHTLECKQNEPYSLYWNTNKNNNIKNVMLFYTKDGGMIAGIAVDVENSQDWLNTLAEEVNGNYGFISLESAPPEKKRTLLEFAINQTN